MAKESWNTVLRAVLPRTSDTPREESVVLSSFTLGLLGPAEAPPLPGVVISGLTPDYHSLSPSLLQWP